MLKKKKYLNQKEAAKFIGISTRTLRNWKKSGYLVPTKKFGGRDRYNRSLLEIVKYLNK